MVSSCNNASHVAIAGLVDPDFWSGSSQKLLKDAFAKQRSQANNRARQLDAFVIRSKGDACLRSPSAYASRGSKHSAAVLLSAYTINYKRECDQFCDHLKKKKQHTRTVFLIEAMRSPIFRRVLDRRAKWALVFPWVR